MPNGRGVTVLGLSLFAALLLATPAWATIDNVKSYKLAYPGKDAKAYSCKVCHQGAIGKKGDLNAYGLALQNLKAPADPKKLTEQDYKAIEVEDSDQDGASNLDEITAGTAPGDPSSVPPGTPVKPSSQGPSEKPSSALHPQQEAGRC